MKRQKLSIAAVMLLITGVIASSCAGGSAQPSVSGGTGAGTTAKTSESTTTSALSTIKKQDYGGYVFKIVSTNQDKRQVDVIAEEETGATLNDLVYRRNSTIEESFNVKIEATDMEFGSINSLIQKNVSAGDNTYSLYMTNATAYTLASEGYLLPFNDIDSMDITKPWWDQSAVSGMSIGGNSYLITGDISPTGLLTSECIIFNKKLFDSKGIKYPYDTAFDGKWTIDRMTEIASGLTEDINGDGKISVNDDMYSFTLWCDAGTALFYGCGGYMSKKDAGGLPSLDWNTDKLTGIYNKIYKLVIGTNANYSTSDHEGTFKLFNVGRAYFCDITFQKIEMFLRDMNDDYGVLPLPKYDESQKNYTTNVSGAGTMIVMPASATDLDKIGTLIDATAAAAYDMITPSLYDVIASTKNVRDEESARMVQLIIRNRVFDPVRMYYIDGHNFADDLLKDKSTDVASYFAAKENTAKAALQKLIDAFQKNNKEK